MKETSAQREVRREFSRRLTALINNAANHPGIRKALVESLAEIADRIDQLDASVREKFPLRKAPRAVRFYIKGGNAFDAIMAISRGDHDLFGVGKSDWDTQAIIDPWLPATIQNSLYGDIEDILIDALRTAGLKVATAINARPQDVSPLRPVTEALPADATVNYTLACDSPQTLRRVFDRDRLGLWTDDRRQLSDETIPSPTLLPGILLNDGIKPFALHRLGYTWHGERQNGAGAGPDPNLSSRPILMELIDVTLPRRDTIEAVATWSDLERNRLRIVPGTDMGVTLPLPDLDYHLRENLTMICEVADKSSHHADKLPKRLQRIGQIYQSYTTPERQAGFRDTVNAMAGDTVAAEGDSAEDMCKALMDSIAQRTAASDGNFWKGHVSTASAERITQGRQRLRRTLETMRRTFGDTVLLSVAYSDDLAMFRALAENPYLAIDRIGFCGIDAAAVIRASYEDIIGFDTAEFARALGASKRKSSQDDVPGKGIKVEWQSHNTPRPGGPSYECTFVVFDGHKATTFLTLTSASALQAPFQRDPDHAGIEYASLLDMDTQRKAAAALIEDYLVRTALSRQHDAIRSLLVVD
ncbi:hypothetical protein [Stenotrophomonas sp.]|uniref:hypothetical protein n=1 Tax=Stenotrophomonas sp. TaxID=69392 RepID=UPI002898FDA1|nr:hypothetical protein [Stenotrophomonas sp.]